MPIDLDVALGAEFGTVEFSWTATNVQLYNLALGAGADPIDPRELSYVVDNSPQVLPTFGCVAASFNEIEPPKVSWPGVEIDLAKILHASEQVTVPAPLPPSGSARATSRIVEIWDKGKAAVVVLETSVTGTDGAPLWTQRRSIFARGEGGFGGERGPSTSVAAPERAPDVELDIPILPQQALLYRLCGDRNPLHSDPEFAAAAGFPRPILHGLCTYGMTCKAIVDALLDADAAAVRSYGARFAGVAYPGETLRVAVWKEDGRLVASVVAPSRDNAVVLSGVELIPA
ncbi:MaoC/PaaZ C-terminal domain-containing protein [Mycobacterium shimoidei]|uniref:Putative dehydrogenase. Possible 2-enoyl acyl-CoA hydratase [Mycobacterium tuberculosis H37Rv] n=1 Tax=Mycobacterium shimoidei TaxID=29313 RepID=A0A1E3TJZ1_MYCSH|nr:MaoC/PaaZ C-terminal domain-containing protein [Mycobacterium shimoidei]MCV7259441.1 MaoC family dehydratase N-terminal domain-containing protein [Mycobacterium shimoidei]ODR14685.1 3-alpha,7-alpha,12-alpha-trihydroxy-5-beta-cholest-24-enoyl-CoA hydratase [Mycobacterium shimoidei]ORW81049.1 3-alpha,7-alpha,12-alpha-trihydroxy-5-beta-cholest-24-enoyl-CoA hydratase [Mycobacterium shimoidei]SRX93360.1 putative dehydrogenase. Possible 2-enoyl acyl-CoA hydratase [Mycobacterium tuberculosis H37Rv]